MIPALRHGGRTRPMDITDVVRNEFDRFFGGLPTTTTEGSSLVAQYPVDLYEDENSIYVEAELPGFSKDELDVSLHQDVLNINAERKAEERKGKQHMNERRFTRVQRTITLPAEVDESKIEAGFKDGVLKISIEKSPEAAPRRVKIM